MVLAAGSTTTTIKQIEEFDKVKIILKRGEQWLKVLIIAPFF